MLHSTDSAAGLEKNPIFSPRIDFFDLNPIFFDLNRIFLIFSFLNKYRHFKTTYFLIKPVRKRPLGSKKARERKLVRLRTVRHPTGTVCSPGRDSSRVRTAPLGRDGFGRRSRAGLVRRSSKQNKAQTMSTKQWGKEGQPVNHKLVNFQLGMFVSLVLTRC